MSKRVYLWLLPVVAFYGLFGYWVYPYWFPARYLEGIQRATAPTIAAIDRYVDRVGSPPDSLEALLPDHDASRAGTGYPRQEMLEYHVGGIDELSGKRCWVLVICTDAFELDSDTITFTSWQRTWHVSE